MAAGEGVTVEPQPNDRNISMQHIETLLGRTCCMHLATLLQCVATCCNLLGVAGLNLKLVKFSMKHLWMFHDVAVV